MFLIGCVALLLILGVWLWMRERSQHKQIQLRLEMAYEQLKKISALEEELKAKSLACFELEMQKRVLDEKIYQLEQVEQQLKNVFSTLSREALEKNNRSFLDLAKASLETFQAGAKGDLDKRQIAIAELMDPIKNALHKLDTGIREIEKERKGDQASLTEQVKALSESERLLKQETSNLVKALRTPLTRGRWGEIQLRRVVELAGMLNHCDFFEQTQEIDQEARYRPDLIVRLPGGRQVIIDAKVPLQGFLETLHTSDETLRLQHLADHARQVRSHVLSLSKKAYWEKFQPTPEFVVLFLPAETFFSAALEADPSLIEMGAEQNVIIATPTTLIALLRAVSYGWKQENLSRKVETLHELGQDLYKRLGDMNAHFSKMGRSLSSAVEAYNKGIGSFESRVLVTARKFTEIGIHSTQVDLETPESVDKLTRELALQKEGD